MPASYVHERMALEARQRLSGSCASSLSALLTAYEAALLTGAQGPDPFFFYRFFSRDDNTKISALGSRLHDARSSDFLLALLAAAMNEGEAALAYALGFFSHFATDSTIHPYVYAHSYDREGRYRSNLHCALEAAMDTALYRRHTPRGIPRQMNGLAALPPAQAAAIARALNAAIMAVYPGDAPGQEVILRSFADALRITRLLHSPTGIKYRLLSLATNLLGHPGLLEAHALPLRLPAWDFANEARLAWSSPWTPDQASRQSLWELMDEAMARTAALWAEAMGMPQSEENLRALIGDAHYGSGLPWQMTGTMRDGQRRTEMKHNAED